MKKLISLLLSATLIAGTFATTVMAEAATATIAFHGLDAAYNSNQYVLDVTLAGVEADSYTYQWYNSTEENGTYSPMYKETNPTYVLSNNDYNTYIKCEVTPYSNGVAGGKITSDVYYLPVTRDSLRIQAISRDQSTINNYKNNPSTYKVNIGGENIIILDEYADSFYVITDAFKGWHTFGDSSTKEFLPNNTSNIGYWLNNDFLTSNQIASAMQKYIPTHKWWVEPGNDSVRTPYSFDAKISLLSAIEYGKYLDRIGWGPYDATGDWWLRNSRPWNAGPSINVVVVKSNTSRLGQTNQGQTPTTSCLVRPTFYLTDDIFLEEKANLSNMGAGIKEMMVERYSNDEDMAKLEKIYTDEELLSIGFTLDKAYVVSNSATVGALSRLSVSYEDANAVSYEYQWYTSDNADSGYVPAITETADTYIVSNRDMNKYIKAEITPVYADGSKGEAVTTSNNINVTQLGRLNRTGYGDDREANKNNPTANRVTLGKRDLWILDEFSGETASFYVITSPTGRAAFDADNTTKFDPSDSNNIGYLLNTTLLTNGYVDGTITHKIGEDLQKYIPTVTWWTEAGHSGSNSPADYSVDAKIGLMSRPEYEKYWGKFGWDPEGLMKSGWWLRSGRGSGGKANTVFAALGVANNYPNEGSNSWGNTWDQDANSTGYYIRPTFYLNEDVFKNIKADVATLGEDVKEMLVRRFTVEDLMHLYTPAELKTIGFDVKTAIITSSSETVGALTTLTAEYEIENAVSYEYEWLISDSENGEFITAMSEKTNKYVVSNYDMNKYIKAVVTPVYEDGSKGQAVETSNVINVTQLGKLSRTGYGDDREANKNNPNANYVRIGNEDVLILSEYSDETESFYVLSTGGRGRSAFDADNTTKFDPSDENNIGYVLNNTMLTTGLVDGTTTYKIDPAVQPYIPTVTWWTEAGDSKSATPADYSVDAKISLMSRSEYEKYWGKFGWDPDGNLKSGWWLRTGRGSGGDANSVFAALGVANSYPNASQNSWGNTWNKPANNTGFYVRPAYFLTEDVFRNVKANVDTMGADVKKMILARYEKSELAGLYTEAELGKIGYEMIFDIPQKYNNIYTKNEAKFDVSYVAQDMDDIIITYSNGTVSDSVTEFLFPDDLYETTVEMSKLPYGENDVTITMTNSAGDILCETTQKMYIFPEQPETNLMNAGVCVHPAQFRSNNKVYEIARNTGFTRVRTDFPWAYIETEKGVYDFELFDSIVEEAENQGIEITAILCYNNGFYMDEDSLKGGIDTDEELAGFINYVKAVANRYPEIDTYEIWNEPNGYGFWYDEANVNDYSNLVKAVSDALYAINPDYEIYAGAIDVSKDGEDFANAMFNNGLYSAFDGLSYHPYFHASVESKFEPKIDAYKDIIIANGGFKKLAATEYSFNDSSDDQTARAAEVVKATIVSYANNVEDNFIFTISQDTAVDANTYGVYDESYIPFELAYTTAYANSVLGDARFVGTINTQNYVSGYMFVKNGSPVSVYWKENSTLANLTTKTVSVPSGAAAYDVKGNAISGSEITLTSSPVYIIGGSQDIQAAATNEKTIRINAIKSEFSLTTVTKDAIMNSSLSEVKKRAALYMLYEANKVDAVYNSISDASDLTVPTAEYEAVDCGGNVYAEAALKLAKKYIDKSIALDGSTLADKNNVIAANNKIAKDLIESAVLLADVTGNTDPAITNVNVTDGVLTFDAENIENADVWVATYAGGKLVKAEKLSLDNLTANVGTNSGKIFVWNAGTMVPVIPATEF